MENSRQIEAQNKKKKKKKKKKTPLGGGKRSRRNHCKKAAQARWKQENVAEGDVQEHTVLIHSESDTWQPKFKLASRWLNVISDVTSVPKGEN